MDGQWKGPVGDPSGVLGWGMKRNLWMGSIGDPWVGDGEASIGWIHVWGIREGGMEGTWGGSMLRGCRGICEGPMRVPERIHKGESMGWAEPRQIWRK